MGWDSGQNRHPSNDPEWISLLIMMSFTKPINTTNKYSQMSSDGDDLDDDVHVGDES